MCVLCDGEELVTDFSVKRSYRGEVLVMPEGAPPLQGEWQTAKNGKRYFKTTQPGVMKYGRASSAGEHLKGSGDGLANWKAAMAAIGTVMSDSVRSERANLINRYDGDPYYKGNDGGWQSGKSQLLAAVDKACEIGGSSTASSRGTEFHHLAELVNSGQTPRIVQPHLVEHLEHYQQVMAPVKFIAQEILVVNDLLERAGSVDYLLELPAGVETPEGKSDKPLVVVGDLKSGKDAPDYLAPIAAQLACYGRGLRYDQETNTRTELHPDFDGRWGVLVHFPIGQPNARVRLFWVDLGEGLKSALQSKAVGESLKWWKGRAQEFTL